MVLLAFGFTYFAWEQLKALPYHLGPIAVGVPVLSVLLAVYAYGRRKEVGELKILLEDLQATCRRGSLGRAARSTERDDSALAAQF